MLTTTSWPTVSVPCAMPKAASVITAITPSIRMAACPTFNTVSDTCDFTEASV